MRILEFLRKVRRHFECYNPSIKIFISKKRLINNLREYQKKYPSLLFAPVLKSNAYGHGLVPVAKILNKERIAFLVLDSMHEAVMLRKNGIKSEILIIGYTQPENIKSCQLSKTAFTITSLEQLREIVLKVPRKIKIHLKIDTGMHRQGILPEELNDAIQIIKENKLLILEGVCSHFADADNTDDSLTRSQITKWQEAVTLFRQNFENIKFFHISATAGAPYSKNIFNNVLRLGIGLYGIDTSLTKEIDLKPVLKMQSIITSVKNLEAGESIGYNASVKLKAKTAIATVPVGYFEGVDRRLSNIGFFKMGETFCPIMGKISMNITSIDVSSISKPKIGDEVTIFSENSNDLNSIENMAKIIGAIPWEILVHIPAHLRRIITK